MRQIRFVATVLAAVMLSGCVTQTIQQSKDVSTSGIAYTEAIDKFLDVAMDNAYKHNTELLVKSHISTNPEVRLDRSNGEIKEYKKQMDRFRLHNDTLNSYFKSLQALADSPVKTTSGASVQALSKNISDLNGVLVSKKDVSLTSEQQAQIGAIAGLAAQAVQAGMLRAALKRDAEVVATALAIQERGLDQIADKLKSSYEDENRLFNQTDVSGPYVNQKKDLSDDWPSKRIKYIEFGFASEQLNTVHLAAKKMRDVWADIVQGQPDPNSLKLLIGDLDEFVVTASKLSDESKKK